jgi:phosphate transport system permease protein
MAAYKLKSRNARKVKNQTFKVICIAAAGIALVVLATLLVSILRQGLPRLFGGDTDGPWGFITTPMSSDPDASGIGPAVAGSISILLICALSAIPLGVATAVLLEEYRPKHKWLRTLHGFVQSNITNLAGVPSIVYGILGFTVFVIMFNAVGTLTDPWVDFGQSFYHQYPGAGGEVYYVKAHEGMPLETATIGSGLTFYASIKDAKAGKPTEVEIREPGELAALRKSAEQRLYAINSTMKDALRSATVDGQLQVTEQSATEKAGEMLSPFRETMLADYETMKEIAAEKLLAMNGMSPIDQIVPRRHLRDALIDAELEAAGLKGIIIEGTEPLEQTVQHWYYFQLPFGKGVLAGGLTLMLVILPIIIVSSQEAIRAVSQEMRSGVLALGGTKWQSIEKVVLPAAIPGVCTGTILALSRAIGEAAPILLIGYVGMQTAPDHLMAGFAALPLEIYNWTSEPDEAFKYVAAAGIIVLLVVLFSFNATAVFIRQKFQKNLS